MRQILLLMVLTSFAAGAATDVTSVWWPKLPNCSKHALDDYHKDIAKIKDDAERLKAGADAVANEIIEHGKSLAKRLKRCRGEAVDAGNTEAVDAIDHVLAELPKDDDSVVVGPPSLPPDEPPVDLKKRVDFSHVGALK